VSYDVAVWEGERPATDAEAAIIFQDLADEADESDLAPTPAIREFVEALVQRWPEGEDDGPWSTEPLIGSAVGGFAYLSMRFSSVEFVMTYLVHQAEFLGLVCFDPQAECLLPSSDEDWADDEPGVVPESGAAIVVGRADVAAMLGMSPRRVARFLPLLRLEGDDLDFAQVLTLSLLSTDGDRPAERWVEVVDVIRAWWATAPDLSEPAMLLVDDASAQMATAESFHARPVGQRTMYNISGFAGSLLRGEPQG
jgi:hypothetical protein